MMAAPTSLRDTRVKRFSPMGASDSLDATDEFPGACSALTNLVPDLTTKNVWTCRPGATLKVDFTAFVSPNGPPERVSVFKVVGNIVYGMVGNVIFLDHPFAYDLNANAFITMTITGGAVIPQTVANQQAQQPTMDLVGHIICITHPSYNPAISGGYRGIINIANPAAPVYNTGDITGAITFAGLGTNPDWVVQFNQRAYWGVNSSQPSVVASDVLVPGTVTNAGQALTFGNNLPLTAAAPLGLSNQLGGIIQSLMIFQGITNIQQVTGDFTLSTWAVNTLNVATGTPSPRSICSTPLGLAFIAIDGLRIIDPNGVVSEPVGSAGTGINYPFTLPNTLETPLTCAGCDGVTIRVSVTNVVLGASQEWWYNIVRKVWSGPHGLFSANMYGIWAGTFLASPGVFFSLTQQGLWVSNTSPMATSVFTENGVALTFTMQSSMLEDSGQMAQSELTEMQLVAGAAAAETLAITLLDSNRVVINTANSVVLNDTGSSPGLYPYRVDFPSNSVFNRVAVSITGTSAAAIKLGDSWLRMRTLGYITNNT